MNPSASIAGSISELQNSCIAALPVVLLCLFSLYMLRSRKVGNSSFLNSQPWAGWKEERLSYVKGRLRSVYEAQSILAEGYSKFSKLGKAFVFWSIPSGPVLILPRSQLKDVLHRPDGEVDGNEALNTVVQIEYTVSEKEIYTDKFHFNIVRKQLTRNLGNVTPIVAEEIDLALKDYWGIQSEWHQVEIVPLMLRIVARVTSRIFYGPELCRNEKFLDHVIAYSGSIVNGGALIQLSPGILQPLTGRLIGYIGKKHMNKARSFSIPFIETRLRQTQKKLADPSDAWEPPTDGLQWLIDECYKTGQPDNLTAPSIAHRLLILNMMAVDSTALTTSNALLDIYSTPSDVGVLPSLREELSRALASSNGVWTKDTVDSLVRTDSAIRESMRYSCFGLINFARRVAAPGGVTLEDGTYIPNGVKVAAAMDAIHHDEALYSKPNVFDAFRFLSASEGQKQSRDLREQGEQTTSSTTVSNTFLTFGYGRHACPGRFFATQEMKLIVAHTLLKYEIEPLKQRPQNKIFLEFSIPDDGLRLNVRRID
ncbi:hypothetical protein GJ744_012274 [Endocarpon pusillum]|uniref:Cytochrome P450 n=1 Tax=Endocarpon pusillum TaxID=364733 RepID=A0A8H7ADZ2_9EURO|nr:hypothetical protein GJ744_012274 [Endocarpon pusillum]